MIIMNSNTRAVRTASLLLAFLLFPCLALGAQVVSVKKDNVNVRSGPGTNFPVSMELFQGYPLKVLEKKGDWLKISDFENDSGWIYSPLVSPGSTVITNGKKSINMRSQPNTTASIVATVERGVVLTKLSTQGKWVKVRHSQGTTGWIYSPVLWP